jgi:serine/threonine protein phosphatase 1
MTDIHGSFQTFSKLLKKLDLQPSDRLFILGDMIDRAPYSLYVIEKIARLIVDDYAVYPLRGNHEQLFLDYAASDPRKLTLLASRQYSGHLLADGFLPFGIARFFESLPYFYETEDHFLVHAGFDTGKKKPLASWKDMLWIRSYPYDKSKLKGKQIVHGHVPTSLDKIKRAVKSGKRDIKLDNGCIRAGVRGYGKLICWDPDENKLYTQKNVDLAAFTESGRANFGRQE